jgi:hypothetical protein
MREKGVCGMCNTHRATKLHLNIQLESFKGRDHVDDDDDNNNNNNNNNNNALEPG